MLNRRLLIASAALLGLSIGTSFHAADARAEPMKIAYLSPAFDISDAWERVFWAIQGRLDELGVDYDMQALAVASHVDHAGQLAQVESVIATEVDYVFLGPTDYEAGIPRAEETVSGGDPDRGLQLPRTP